MRYILFFLMCFIFISCGKNKEVTETKKTDSAATQNTVTDQEKQKLEKENKELKEKLEKQEEKSKNQSEQEKKDISSPNDDKIKKDVQAWYDYQNSLYKRKDKSQDSKVVSIDIADKIQEGANLKVICNVRVIYPVFGKDPKYAKITMNYAKYGDEWKAKISESLQ
ncbi:MAG: hypothetical protein HY959_03680 [Ignavibacteriae bacterium]|nr:hypothetical protein [Ignavibacteriota bacterium]